MKPQDIFGIILRLVALYISLWGAWNTLAGIRWILPTIQSVIFGTSPKYSTIDYWFYGIPALLFGITIFLLAESLVGITYPSPKPPALPKQVDPCK